MTEQRVTATTTPASASSIGPSRDCSAPLTAAVLDADLVDDYFIRILLGSFLSDIKPIHRHLSLSHNTSFLSNASLSNLWVPLVRIATLFACHGQTPGVRLLGLRRTARRSHAAGRLRDEATSLDNPSHWSISNAQLGTYAAFSVILPLLYERLKYYWIENQSQRLQRLILSRAWHEDNGCPPTACVPLTSTRALQLDGNHSHASDDSGSMIDKSAGRGSTPLNSQEVAWDRQERVAALLIKLTDTIIPSIQLAALLVCWSGRSSTPSAAMVLSGLRFEDEPLASGLSATNSTRRCRRPLAVDFGHRRWLYHQLARTAKLLWIGLAMTDTWRPIVDGPWRRLRATLGSMLQRIFKRLRVAAGGGIGDHDQHGEKQLKLDASRECLICRANPVIVPVESNCRCHGTYCYTCLYHFSRRGRGGQLRRQDHVCRCISCGESMSKARFL